MNKKYLITVIVIIFFGAGVVTGLVISRDSEDIDMVSSTLMGDDSIYLKDIQIPNYTQQITLQVPFSYNVFYNGDPESIMDVLSLPGFNAVSMSISSGDRPVTHSDLNGQQLDFYITDGDYLGEDYVETVNSTETDTMQQVQTDSFEGYSSTSVLLPGETPSKANTGGTTYYLRPKTTNPDWNLIVNKQALGDNEFEAAVDKIINSISFTE